MNAIPPSKSAAPPLLVEFLPGSRIQRQARVVSALPVLQNGPPGTFVDLPTRIRVSLPTDQIVSADESSGAARIGFGGMAFEGLDADGALSFQRVRDLEPAERLSPERGQVMKLRPAHVARIEVEGSLVWPTREG